MWFWKSGSEAWKKKKICSTNEEYTHKSVLVIEKLYASSYDIGIPTLSNLRYKIWKTWFSKSNKQTCTLNKNRSSRSNLWYKIRKTLFWKSNKHTCTSSKEQTHKSVLFNHKVHRWLIWYLIYVFKHENRS